MRRDLRSRDCLPIEVVLVAVLLVILSLTKACADGHVYLEVPW